MVQPSLSTTKCRSRNKKHMDKVRRNPCLICLSPYADAHHLTFSEPKALGMKVSDIYTVPLCRTHHSELHAFGSEILWWELQGVSPTEWIYERFGISLPV